MKKITINDNGRCFYRNKLKDTRMGLFVMTPGLLIVFTLLFSMIIGFTWGLLFVLSFPVLTIILAFVYVPLFYRKQYINNIIASIEIDDQFVKLETFGWFFFTPQVIFFNIKEISCYEELSGELFFKEQKVFKLKLKGKLDVYYLVHNFFDHDIHFG